MLQPFEKFQAEYIDVLKKLRKNFIISQSYTRGFSHSDEVRPTDILFTSYDDAGLAKIHLNAIRGDKYAYMLDLNNEKHASKIKEMLVTGSTYAMYWSVVKDASELKKMLDRKYKDNIRRYITVNTSWRIEADETVKPALQVIFGELYIILKRGTQQVRIKFEDIEKS